jgi:uncharacterized repeat protein (TIGR01451 family)
MNIQNQRTVFRQLRASTIFSAIISLLALSLQPMTAGADQSPGTCNSNNLDLTLTKNKTVVRPGDVITYSVYVANINRTSSVACDITGATVTVTLPAANGTPTGPTVTLTSGTDYLAGTTATLVGSTNYTVNVAPGVADVVAQAAIAGTLHDAPVNHAAEITKTVGSDVTQPHLTVTATPDQPEVITNTPVEYTYTVTNDSTTNAPLQPVSLTDNRCSPVILQGGDTNSNNTLDVGETWTYSCQTSFLTPGTFQNIVTVNGIDTADGLAIDPVSTTASIRIIDGLPGLPRTGVVHHERSAR